MPDPQSPDPITPGHEGPKRPARWGRRFLILAGVLLLGFLGAAFALSRFLDPERLAGWLEPRLETAVNRDVEIERLSVGFLPPGVRLSGLTVADPTGLAPELARVSSLDFRVRLLPLLSRRVEVREIVLDGLRADLRVGPDGLSNFGDLSPESEEDETAVEAGSPPFALELQGMRLTSGGLSYRNEATGQAIALEALEGESSLRREPAGDWFVDGRFGGSLSVEGVADGAAGGPASEDPSPEAGGWLRDLPVELTLAMEVPDDAGALRIREGTLSVEELALALTGEVRNLKEPVRELELAVQASRVPLGRVLSLVPDTVMDPDEVEADGTLSADLAVRGAVGPEATPNVTGVVSVDGGTVRFRGRTLSNDLDLRLTLTEEGTVQPQGRGELLGGDFELAGTVMTEPPRSLEIRIGAAPDLGRIDPAFLPPGVELAGTTPLDLRIAGELENPRGLGAWGSLGLRQLRATHPALGVPVSVATADLAMEGRSVRIPATGILLGEDRLTVEGILTGLLDTGGAVPDFRGSARGPRLSLEELKVEPTPDTALTYGQLAFARVGGRQVRGQSADAVARDLGLARPATLPLAGEVEVAIDTVLDRKGRMEDVRATVRFGPEFAQVSDARFRRYGGAIRASANLALGEEATEPFSLVLSAQGVEAGAFLSETTPLGQAVTGRLNLDLDLTGDLHRLLLPTREALQGTGSFSLTGGGIQSPVTDALASYLGMDELRSMRFRDWSTSFVLQDGRLLVDESLLDGAPGSPRVGGGIGLDGGLDITSVFDLPRADVAASALADLGVPGASDLVRAVIRIGGQVGRPSLQADPTATVTQVTDAVEAQAREEIDAVIEEQKSQLEDRANRFLRGLLGGGGAGRDSLPRDSIRPDTLRPDTLRPDTLRPDTLRRDTLPPDTSGVG